MCETSFRPRRLKSGWVSPPQHEREYIHQLRKRLCSFCVVFLCFLTRKRRGAVFFCRGHSLSCWDTEPDSDPRRSEAKRSFAGSSLPSFLSGKRGRFRLRAGFFSRREKRNQKTAGGPRGADGLVRAVPARPRSISPLYPRSPVGGRITFYGGQ